MRKLVVVVAAGFAVLGLLALMPLPANAELKTTISGSIRLNAHYIDVIAAGIGQEEAAPTTVPYTAGFNKSRQADNDQTRFDARRTRLQMDMSDQVGSIKISGRFQGDFDTSDGNANTSNSRHFRIRLGWGQWATPSGWIVRFGQMRTMVSEYGDNLFGGVGDADTVDENGEWDQLQGRQAGVHVGWGTKMMGGDLLVGVGVENSATTFQSSTAVSALGPQNQGVQENVPLFGAAARYRTPLWAVFVRGAAQKHREILDSSSHKDGADTAVTGWLGAISAEVTPGPLRIFGMYWFADGLNRLGGTFADVSSEPGGFVGQSGFGPANSIRHIKAIETHNWHAGAEYKLTKDLKATALYEYQGAVPNRKIFDLTATSADKNKFQAVHAGLIYSFWTRFDTGLEYQWGRVDSFGSSEGVMNAVNWRLRFYF